MPSIRKYGKTGRDTLVIMPFYTAYDYLSSHIDLLKKQTFREFDLLIVLSSVSDDTKVEEIIGKATPDFGIITFKRDEDTGSAGGFSSGQAFALDNGYDYMVITDDDCLPIDPRIMEELYRNRDKGFVSTKFRFMGNVQMKVNVGNTNITYYSLISRELVERIGIYYAPLYLGGDDMEYNERIGRKPFVTDCYCEHPFFGGDTIFRKFDRYWLYLLHACLFSKNPRFFLINLGNLTVTSLILMLFYPDYGKDVALTLLRLLLTYTYGKPAIRSLQFNISPFLRKESELGKTPPFIVYSDTEKARGFAETIRLFIANFRKRFIVLRTNHVFKGVTMGSLFAKELYFKMGEDKYLQIAKRGGPLPHILRLAAFLALLPFYWAALWAVFLPIKLIRQPRTHGYGLAPMRGRGKPPR